MNQLLEEGGKRGLAEGGREALRTALAAELGALRAAWRSGREAAPDEAFWDRVAGRLEVLPALGLRRVLNATGVVLHTNLGRAPWAPEAVEAAARTARYGVVEIDLATGGRGGRAPRVAELLAELSGAEDGLAVNNNAAAALLALAALARGRKVVVARSELVEIGGSYRMPAVVAAAGATMVEVGTTNRVHLKDFARALEDPEVACVFKAHPSNFRIEGFHHEAPLGELAALCREHGVPLVYDLGSGVLHGAGLPGVRGEPTVRDALAAGCDLVTFSGDKLLGGPQAGLVVGARSLVRRLRRDMLTRCVRLDKTILAGLEATLSLHALGEEAALQRVPALRALARSVEELRGRAERLAAELAGAAPAVRAEVVDCASRVGSGAAPTEDVPSAGLRLTRGGASAEAWAAALRAGEPPVVARIQDEALLLDLRTVEPDEEETLLGALARTAGA
jgi:L-seryl-tRNA(Ser) seleniumtransferase